MAKNVVVITGSRADYGLMEPVIDKLHDEANLTLLVTGSHLSQQFGYTAQYIPSRYHQILIPGLVDYDEPLGVCHSMSLLLPPLAAAIANTSAEAVVILGDRYEMLAAAIAAHNLQVPIHHIQGGDVTTGSLDDGYRNCITQLASFHYVATQPALTHINDMGVYAGECVGSLACVMPEVEPNSEYDYVVVFHPCKDNNLHEYLAELTEYKARMLLIGSNADAGGRHINDIMITLAEHAPDQFDYVPSMERETYLSYLAGGRAIIGNSSSGIFEAPVLKTPTINVGTRQLGRLLAKSVIQWDDPYMLEHVLVATRDIEIEFDCPYYKPNTVKNIVDGILQ